MALRFTPSKDGVDRCTVRLSLRLSRDEVDQLREAVGKDWRGWLEDQAALALETELTNEDGSYEQHYGKGDA